LWRMDLRSTHSLLSIGFEARLGAFPRRSPRPPQNSAGIVATKTGYQESSLWLAIYELCDEKFVLVSLHTSRAGGL
jgi:hypothetical protein